MPAPGDSSTRRRGRPAGHLRIDPADILDEVLTALPHGGYGGLSVRAIARASGVSLATVQHHFGNKESLWKAAIDRLVSTSIGDDGPAVEAGGLLVAIPDMIDQATSRPGLWASVMSDQTDGADWRLRYIADRLQEQLAAGAAALEQAQELGLARPVDPQILLALMLLGIGSIGSAPEALEMLFGFDMTRETDRRRLGEGIADVITNGVVAR